MKVVNLLQQFEEWVKKNNLEDIDSDDAWDIWVGNTPKTNRK